MSRDDLAARATKICTQQAKTIAQIPRGPANATNAAGYLGAVLSVVENGVKEFHRLSPPSDEDAIYRMFLRELDRNVDILRTRPRPRSSERTTWPASPSSTARASASTGWSGGWDSRSARARARRRRRRAGHLRAVDRVPRHRGDDVAEGQERGLPLAVRVQQF